MARCNPKDRLTADEQLRIQRQIEAAKARIGTYTEIAQRAGIPQPVVSLLRHGRKVARTQKISLLCEYLDDLIGDPPAEPLNEAGDLENALRELTDGSAEGNRALVGLLRAVRSLKLASG